MADACIIRGCYYQRGYPHKGGSEERARHRLYPIGGNKMIGNIKRALIGATVTGVLVMGLYGCGDTPPAATPTSLPPTSTTVAEPTTPAEPTEITEPSVTVEATAAMAEPSATMAIAEEATATTATSSTGGSTGDVKALFDKAEQAMKSVKSYHFTSKIDAAQG